jgi:ankyrin repeat protein
VIFSSVIDEISATLPDTEVVYFYCKNNDPLRSHFTDIAKSLISQILQINPNCSDFIYESMLAGGERRAKDPSKLLQILGQILTNHDSIYIGIDGVDECSEEERKLLSNLITMCSRAEDDQGNVRIIVTSRQEKDLEKSLKAATKLNIKPENLENDITAYVYFQNCHISIARKLLDDKNYERSSSRASYNTTSALAMACTYGHLEVVSLLLEKHSDYFVKKVPMDFNRALNAAIKEKKVPCAKLLLDWALKKDPSILPTKLRDLSEENTDYMIEILYTDRAKVIEEGGGTKGNALQAAARKGDCEAVSHLLDLGADIDNYKGSYGTPMIAAASNGKLEVVRLLLERGADFKRKDGRKYGTMGSAIDAAAAACHETVFRELLNKGAVFTHESIHTINYSRNTSLQALSRRANSAALVRLLLENGANVDGIVKESRRPLRLALEYGEIATLQVLLEYGADANAKSDDREGNTALHIASKEGYPKKMGILLDHGADINAINNIGETVLMAAVLGSWEKCRKVIHILIERGADIGMTDKVGNTALMFAAGNWDQPLEKVQILVERGADSSNRNLKGLTALMMAADCGNVLVVECLLQRRTSQDIEGNSQVWSAVESATRGAKLKPRGFS